MSDTSSVDLRAIEELDAAWNEAYARNDRGRLAEILADDFEATDAGFRVVSKAMLMQPTPAPNSLSFSERSLKLFGATAVTRGRLQLAHATGTVDQRFLRVYSKRGTRWRAVAVQVFPAGGGDAVGAAIPASR